MRRGVVPLVLSVSRLFSVFQEVTPPPVAIAAIARASCCILYFRPRAGQSSAAGRRARSLFNFPLSARVHLMRRHWSSHLGWLIASRTARGPGRTDFSMRTVEVEMAVA